MLKSVLSLAVGVAALALTATSALSAEVTLKVHHFLPPQATIPKHFIEPWARKLEKDSGGRIEVKIFPAMQLGGKPPALYDQMLDGVADIVWTLPGYTPGRFPKTEVFELPFMPTNGENTSRALWDYYDGNLRDEFPNAHMIAMHVHGPGMLHVKGEGVRKLEDMKNKKLRGPTRVINQLLSTLGATPVGMPVPAIPEALSKGVVDGTVIPWEITRALKVAELVDTHTYFSGDRALYTAAFVFAMNKEKYDSLPDDLKKIVDANSGIEIGADAGRAMDLADAPARKVAEDRGNAIIQLDDAETARWKEASQPVIANWITEMDGKGHDGAALVQTARDLVAKYAK
ncbi:MAG: TRAP transporter substrate-binding protein [Cohaesibacteraceae bacterium]|nr:TRAP transporter substrate-binding protein [Cohaesibacteraceae bacterium]